MSEHHASCRCGQLQASASGDPVRVSVCHCRNCQKRSGSAFAAQARFPVANVRTEGEAATWPEAGVSGAVSDFHFCRTCGTTLWFRSRSQPETIAVPLGNFEPGHGLEPTVSVWEERQEPWVSIVGEAVEHHD